MRDISFSPKYADWRVNTQTPFERALGYMSLESSGQFAVDHLLPSSVEVTNNWSCTPTVPHTSMARGGTTSPACLYSIFEQKRL